ncbi:FkbM family methyltransferase [Lysinibacillus sphaericus]|uniref:FkbM family methyltransferase n=1 Tax=Lysinibacillus sphaericus TaxID=1421 RepID=UPI003F7B1B15
MNNLKVNRFYTWLYKATLDYGHVRIIGTVLQKMKKNILKRKDPIISFTINDEKMFLSFSHMLPFYQKAFKNYDRQLKNICKYIDSKKNLKGNISVIDIGANIGDTVINIGMKNGKYLLVEGEKLYSHLIHDNLKNYTFFLEQYFLTDIETEDLYVSVANNGTGQLIKDYKKELDDVTTDFITLDKLVSESYPDFHADILKVDTDGFDFKVLRGAKNVIKQDKPVIFFEWDKKSLVEQGENEISIFGYLNDLGYERALLYDNFGELLTIVNTKDEDNLKVLMNYILGSNQRIYYYDVLLIHRDSILDIGEIALNRD